MDRRPLVGVCVALPKARKILLGKRISSHQGGTWALPGGHLEFGEDFEDCAIREVKEETGILITKAVSWPIATVNNVYEKSGLHYVTIPVLAQEWTGIAEIKEPTKCEEWRWCEFNNLPEPLMNTTEYVLKYIKGRYWN